MSIEIDCPECDDPNDSNYVIDLPPIVRSIKIFTQYQLDKAVQKEREECAVLTEGFELIGSVGGGCAEAIRARGTDKTWIEKNHENDPEYMNDSTEPY